MNTTAPIIILGCLKVDMKVSDTGIETIGLNDYREISEDNGDTNSMLAIMQERARFFYKDRQKFINPFT